MLCVLVRLLALTLALLLLLHGSARADTLLLAEDGDLLPGVEGRLLVILHDAGKPRNEATPSVTVSAGLLRASVGRVAEGVYEYRYVPPLRAPDGIKVRVGSADGEITSFDLSLSPPTGPSLKGPRRLELPAGDSKEFEVFLAFQPSELGTLTPPAPEHLRVVASEGSARVAMALADGVKLLFEPDSSRWPRVALIGVWDTRRPGIPPAWVSILLVGHPRIPVQTEPGARVWMNVGTRAYGPFEADSSGNANAILDVYPGEETASVRIEDRIGNVQKTSLNLNPNPRGVMLALAEPRRPDHEPSNPVHLAVLAATGLPWSGEPPRCRLTPGGAIDPFVMGGGLYRLHPTRPGEDAQTLLNPRLDCELGAEVPRLSQRVPTAEGIPRRVILRVYPLELSADFPVAQVQVLLEDSAGERLPPEGVVLSAEIGQIRDQTLEAGSVRAEYHGAAAVPKGGDRIWARYDYPPSKGVPSLVTLGLGSSVQDPSSVEVLARVQDARGGPIQGIPVELSNGHHSSATVTDERGWASVILPLGSARELMVLEARAAGLLRRHPVLFGAPPAPLDPRSSDIEASASLPITAGRIREVMVTADPSVLEAGPGAVAHVTVRLVDRQGNLVQDDTLRLQTSQGEPGPLRLRPDGSYEADYSPPPDLGTGTVRLRVQSREGTFAASTEIQIVPRPLRTALALHGGGITNFGAISSLFLDVGLERRLRPGAGHLLLRLSGAFYKDLQIIPDRRTGEDIEVESIMAPVGLTLLARQERGLSASWIGTGLLVMPFETRAKFGSSITVRGLGFAGPGLSILTGTGWRFGSGELGAEARYSFINSREGALSYSGSMGGLAILGVYRMIF